MPERGGDGRDGARAIDAVDAYWDALVDGGPGAAPPPGLDPDLAAAVRRVQGTPPARPDAAFVARLEEELLMNAHATPLGLRPAGMTIGASTGAAPNGRWSAPPPVPARPAHRRVWGRAMEGLAAAALLLAIGGGLVAGWGLRPDGPNPTPVRAPAIAAATPGAGWGDGAAMERGTAGRTGEEPGPGPAGEPALLWRVPIAEGQGGHFWSTPRVVGGVAYVTGNVLVGTEERRAETGVVVALDPASGAERWRADVTGPASVDPAAHTSVYVGEPAVADGGLFVDVAVERRRERSEAPPTDGAESAEGVAEAAETARTLVALDAATGAERWRVATGDGYGLAPAVKDGVVFAGGGEGVLLALDAATGRERWRTTETLAPRDPEHHVGLGTPAVGEDAVYLTNDASLVAFDVATGAERWRLARRGATEELTDPVVADGTVYVASNPFGDVNVGEPAGRLHALDAATGAERWTYDADPGFLASPLLVGGGLVYAYKSGGEEAELVALDAASGRERWSYAPRESMEFLPVLAGGDLIFTTRDYAGGITGYVTRLLGIEDDVFLYAVDAASGEERWRTEMETVDQASRLAVAGGVIYRLEGQYGDRDGAEETLAAYGDD